MAAAGDSGGGRWQGELGAPLRGPLLLLSARIPRNELLDPPARSAKRAWARASLTYLLGLVWLRTVQARSPSVCGEGERPTGRRKL